MIEYILTFIDTVGVQNYIFNSNELKHIISASDIVRRTLEDILFGILMKSSFSPTNVTNQGINPECKKTIESDLQSELIYTGGGNALILFKSNEQATLFAKILSHTLLYQYAGPDIVITHGIVKWESVEDDQKLRSKVDVLIKKASQKKQDRNQNTPILGLGITANCPYTGFPATGRSKRGGVRVSTEIIKKVENFENANKYLESLFSKNREHSLLKDLNNLPGDEKGSYMAVVHIDGTGMGKRFVAVADSVENQDNRTYINTIRQFSESIKSASTKAMSGLFIRLEELIKENSIDLVENQLPFRPIIFGGDDITFISDGKLGLTLAEFYMEQLTKYDLSDGAPIFARAGVSIIKTHYPFSQAYQLAEDLNKSARTYAKELQEKNEYLQPPYTIDWHISSEGPVLDLQRIRNQLYSTKSSCTLLMRPLEITLSNESSHNWRTWENFESIITDFKYKEPWCNMKSKLKKLETQLAIDSDAVEAFLRKNKLQTTGLPAIPPHSRASLTGMIGTVSAYFDALDTMEFFESLRAGGKTSV